MINPITITLSSHEVAHGSLKSGSLSSGMDIVPERLLNLMHRTAPAELGGAGLYLGVLLLGKTEKMKSIKIHFPSSQILRQVLILEHTSDRQMVEYWLLVSGKTEEEGVVWRGEVYGQGTNLC